jgi:hypothetical protein
MSPARPLSSVAATITSSDDGDGTLVLTEVGKMETIAAVPWRAFFELRRLHGAVHDDRLTVSKGILCSLVVSDRCPESIQPSLVSRDSLGIIGIRANLSAMIMSEGNKIFLLLGLPP